MRVRGTSPSSWVLHVTPRQNWQFPSKNRKTGSQGRRQIQTERPCLRKLLKLTLAPSDKISLQSWRGQRPGFHPGSVPAQPCNLGLGNPPEVACPSGGGVPSAETLRCGQSWVSVGNPCPTLICSHPHQGEDHLRWCPSSILLSHHHRGPRRPHKRF